VIELIEKSTLKALSIEVAVLEDFWTIIFHTKTE
jgi:hypothetical protein